MVTTLIVQTESNFFLTSPDSDLVSVQVVGLHKGVSIQQKFPSAQDNWIVETSSEVAPTKLFTSPNLSPLFPHHLPLHLISCITFLSSSNHILSLPVLCTFLLPHLCTIVLHQLSTQFALCYAFLPSLLSPSLPLSYLHHKILHVQS